MHSEYHKEVVLRAYKAGENIRVIAERHRVSIATVLRWAREAGIPRNRYPNRCRAKRAPPDLENAPCPVGEDGQPLAEYEPIPVDDEGRVLGRLVWRGGKLALVEP